MMLLKYFLHLEKKHHHEAGFTIPLILGFGLFMLAIGLTSIRTSSTSETDSQVQERSKQAIAAAELGLARIQETLDTNRAIAVYDDCETRNSDGTCGDTGNVPSWANATAIRPGAGASSCANDELVSEITDVQEISSTAWQDASNNPRDGQFRLVRYTYRSEAGDPTNPYALPGIATLQVEGRTNQFGIASANTEDEVINTGTARLSVEIPIDTNNGTFQDPLPGLWMRFDTDANMGSQKVAGNIFVQDLTCVASGATPTQITRANNIDPSNPAWDVLSTPQAMPDTPELPATNRLNTIQSSELFNANTVLPRPGIDIPSSIGGTSYNYLVSSLDNVNNPGSIKITNGSTVNLYVQGEIKLAGVVHQTASSDEPPVLTAGIPANLSIYGNVTVDAGTGYQDTDWKYGCGDVIDAIGANLGQANCPTQTLNFQDAARVDAFLHAPDAWGCLTGTGGGTLNGSLWIRQWTAITNLAPDAIEADLGTCTDAALANIVTLDAAAIPGSLLNFATTTFTEPRVAPLTAWERIERN